MRTFFVLGLFALISILSMQSCTSDTGGIVVRVSGVPDTAVAYITGSTEELGQWDPSLVSMKKEGHEYVYELTSPFEESIEFKVTLGSWATEGWNSNRGSMNNYIINSKDTVINLHFDNWGRPSGPSTVEGILDIVELPYPDERIGNRKIRIWRPSEGRAGFKVIYMADGQNLFDAATAPMGVEWQVDESILKFPEYQQFMVVGIDNSQLRMDEYLDTPEGEVYRKWVREVVIPYVDSHYNTLTSKYERIAAGSSAGGTVSLLHLAYDSDLFSSALCFSPAVYYQSEDTQIDLISTFEE